MFNVNKLHLLSFRVILLGFLLVILAGAGLLALPWAAADGQRVSLLDALFTSTSAVCVTGLIVRDTAAGWSLFGKSVILLLIQIGGLGVVTTAAVFSAMLGKRISLLERSIVQDSVSAPHPAVVMRFTQFILAVTLVMELIGAVLLLPDLAAEFGLGKGAWMAVFHSVSAFCNAGFDLMPASAGTFSLISRAGSAFFNVVVILLITVGGIGFWTLEDLFVQRGRLSACGLQTKLILASSAVLVLLPALYFYCCEFESLPTGERVLASLFQSVTTRTAGFCTADFAAMSEPGLLLTICLMLTGGSPGSTAGGMKTTTLAVLVISALSVFRRQNDGTAFGRRISTETVRSAAAILAVYLGLFITASAVICGVEKLPLLTCMFESASALGTVGLSLGVTAKLGALSRCILICLMYVGRVGGLTLIFAAVPAGAQIAARFPEERVSVG